MKNIRNKPCPCGSGKKHKKCCGDAAVLSATRQADNEEFMRRLKERSEKRQAELDAARESGRPVRTGSRYGMNHGTTMMLALAAAAMMPAPSRRRNS